MLQTFLVNLLMELAKKLLSLASKAAERYMERIDAEKKAEENAKKYKEVQTRNEQIKDGLNLLNGTRSAEPTSVQDPKS